MEVLFKSGRSANSYPVRLVYIATPVELQYPAQSMFVVPKRNFKKSPDRNKLKRRMREVYRLNKNALYDQLKAGDKKLLIAFIYTGKKEEEYATIESAILKLIKSIKY